MNKEENKADKIWSIVQAITENHTESAYEIHEDGESVLELEILYAELYELLKDL